MHPHTTPPLTGVTYAFGRSILLFASLHDLASLNTQNELISSCRHAGKCFSFLFVFQVVFCFLIAFLI